MSSVDQLYQNLCEQASEDPTYRQSTMEHAGKLALLIYSDAQNARKYHREFTNLASSIIRLIATYYYNHSQSSVRLQSVGIPAVTQNMLHILRNIHNLVRKYHPTTKPSLSSQVSKPFRKPGGMAIIALSNRFFDEDIAFQRPELKVPIPRNQTPANSTINQAINQPANVTDRDNGSTGSCLPEVPRQNTPLHSPTQAAEHTIHPIPSTSGFNSTELGIEFEDDVVTPDLEVRTSAFPTPTQETPYENNNPLDMEIQPCYIKDEESSEEEYGSQTELSDEAEEMPSSRTRSHSKAASFPSSQRTWHRSPTTSSEEESVGQDTHLPQQRPGRNVQELLGPGVIIPPGPIHIEGSANYEGNRTKTRIIRRES